MFLSVCNSDTNIRFIGIDPKELKITKYFRYAAILPIGKGDSESDS